MKSIDQGPETVAPERLQLPFWSGPALEMERMSASFGPYALTRLCAETGGMYFVAAESRFGPRFEPAVMRNYPPDYRPIRDYHKQLVTNQAKGALVRASKLTWDEGFPRPQLSFRADTDNVLRREITAAQRPLAKLDYRLKELESVISLGIKDREKLKSPRWPASFDLAIGRLSAWRVRAYGYNTSSGGNEILAAHIQNKREQSMAACSFGGIQRSACRQKINQECDDVFVASDQGSSRYPVGAIGSKGVGPTAGLAMEGRPNVHSENPAGQHQERHSVS